MELFEFTRSYTDGVGRQVFHMHPPPSLAFWATTKKEYPKKANQKY